MDYYFPSAVSEFAPAFEQDVVCPRPTGIELFEPSGDLQHLRVLTLGAQSTLAVGNTCQVLILTTMCFTNFVGTQHISRTSSWAIPEPELCEKFDLMTDTHAHLIEHPPPSCSWMQTTNVTHTRVVIKPRHLAYDPIRDYAVDSIFPSGHCSNKFCRTIHASTVWMLKIKPKGCDFARVQYRRHTGSDGTKLLISSTYPPIDESNCCQMEGCGQTLNVCGNNIAIVTNRMTQYCDLSQNISTWSNDDTYSWRSKYLLERLEVDSCTQNLVNLFRHKQMSMLDLAKFVPDHPGKSSVFRINKGTLEVATGLYEKTSLVKGVIQKKGKELSLPDDWTKTGHFEGLYNGIYRDNGKIVIPFVGSPSINNIVHSAMTPHGITVRKIDMSHVAVDQDAEPMTRKEVLKSHSAWNFPAVNVFGSIHSIITLVLSIAALVLIIIVCSKLPSCRRTKPNYTPGFEMIPR